MLKRKKILVVSTTPFYGGGESFIVNILSKIEAETYYIVDCVELYKKLPVDRVLFFQKNGFLVRIKTIKEFIKKHKIETIILNGGSAIYFAPFLRNVRIVIYRHTANQNLANPVKRLLYITVLHSCYFFAHRVISVSKFADAQQKLFRHKAQYIYHGLPLLPYQEKEVHTPLRILFLGRVEVTKGIDIIIDAVSRFHSSEVVLYIVGEGSFKVPKRSNIMYCGFSSNVDEHYASNDLLVSMPQSEAFGLTFIEAMNHSMPVISCDRGAVSEILENGVNGFIVQRNADALYHAIKQFVEDKKLVQVMGKHSNEICWRKFGIHKTLKQINEVINY